MPLAPPMLGATVHPPRGSAPPRPEDGAIPDDADGMPDEIEYDESKRRLLVGKGFVDNVSPEVWNYELSGKRV